MAKDKTQLPKGVTLENLAEHWETCTRDYAKAIRRAYILDATDRGRIWEAVKATFPKYQILPDTNHVSYVKNNLLASIYTVGKSAQLRPTSTEDIGTVFDVNTALEHIWDLGRIGHYQMLAGERAALLNLGITQVGWDTQLTGGSGDFAFTGQPVLKNIDPMKFMRDPYSDSIETAAYCITWDVFHRNILKANPLYRDTLDAAVAKCQYQENAPVEKLGDGPTGAANQKDYFNLVIHWVRDGSDVHEIHTLNNKAVLHVVEKLLPATFPFALLYCNVPAGDLIGTSEPARIFANSFAYNLLNSITMTAEYKNQRPPRFVNDSSGLNIPSFVAHGNEADYTFVVRGDASRAVHYQQFPLPSQNVPALISRAAMDIQQVTGVTDRYTGKSTGSILTTGGMEAALDQATLIDTYKIANYESYATRLTKLVLENLMEHGQKRSYLIKDPARSGADAYKVLQIDFGRLDKNAVRQYKIDISSELPKNKVRVAQMATVLMEKQAQYAQSGGKVEFITPEEWLLMQDLPYKELMQQRMGIQRSADYTEQVSRILFGFAQLTKNGMPAEDAIAAVAQDLQNSRTPGQEQPPAMMEAPPPEMPMEPPVDQGMPPPEMQY